MTEPIDQLARRLLGDVLNGDLKWTPDMRLRIATVAQAYASLAIVDELRALNSGRDQFHREVLDVLTQAKAPGPCGAVFGEDVFHGVELRCTLDRGHVGFHDDSGDVSSLRSEQPAAASTKCRVCERPEGCDYPQSGLTVYEWAKHWDDNFHESISFNASTNGATEYANRETTKRFGPCPEES